MVGSPKPADDLDEPISLSDWKPAWPLQAQELAATFANSIGRSVRIEHIGSTAVEGLQAKPVLDLMIGAQDEAQVEAIASALVEEDWTDLGEAGVPGRRHLRRRSGEHVNLHIVLLGSAHWVNNLAIRDFLRAHRDERRRYAAFKNAIVASGAERLLAYSDRKAPYIAALLERAICWQRQDDGR